MAGTQTGSTGPLGNPRIRWDEARDEQLRSLWAALKLYTVIAGVMAVPPRALRARIARLGLKPRHRDALSNS